MTFEEFKYHYWEVLIKYVSRFHPLKIELIEKYKYVLDWRMLSANPHINWNAEAISRHENKFTWHLLSENPSVDITTEFITKYKIRLDWNNLARNPNLPIDQEFINKFEKHYKIDESHIGIGDSFLEKNSKYIIPKRPNPPQPVGIENCSLNNFTENYKQWSHNTYIEIYKRIIKPNLDKRPIEVILKETIPSPENYFYAIPSNIDKYGLIASFDPVDDLRSLKETLKPKTIEFSQSNLQEGKDRIYNIIKTRAQSFPCLLISETLLTHLKNFDIPKFIEHKAILNTKKLAINENYFFIVFDDNTLISQCEDEHEFEFYFKRFSVRSYKRTLKGKSCNFNELLKETSKDYSETVSDLINFYPKQIDIKSNLDIYTINRKIIFSERLANSISQLGLGPLELRNTYPMSILPNVKSTTSYKHVEPVDNMILIEEDNFYHKKKERLENHDPEFRRFKLFSDRMSKTEKNLNIIFPPEFRDIYLRSKLTYKDGDLEEEFSWLSLEEFSIENSYSDRYPETYKSCLVASNGCGDYVALLLEKDDDYKLDKKLVTFNHETGEIEKGKLQVTLDKK